MDSAACKIPGQRLNHDMVESLHREMTEREQLRARLYCVNCPVYADCYDWVMERYRWCTAAASGGSGALRNAPGLIPP